ncbi:MAG: restriction endonuclease subunit S [Candidatus Pacebacteria bacterium]|nr:restriction endonuclease subunit S [Candidatus Paceibacterota bacterium]
MNRRIIQISKISNLNLKSLGKDDNFNVIKYLDTGNITKNSIVNLKILDTKEDKIPSRAKRRVKNNSIIYSTVRPNQEHYGYLENPDENLIVSTGFTTIDIVDENIDPKFIYYLLTQKQITEYLHNLGMNATSSYPSIKPEDIGNLKFEVPERAEDQKKIAEILSFIDSKIKLNNEINDKLDSIAKTFYEYWFVQFEFPNKQGKPYKSSGGKMYRNNKLVAEVPKGWSVEKVKDLISADKSGDWGKDQKTGNYTQDVFCIRGTDINGLNGKEQCDPPRRFILEKNSHKILNPYDLIIEISGGSPTQSTGRIAYISNSKMGRFSKPLICSNFCKAITLKNSKLIYSFYYFWNRMYDGKVFFGYEGKTSGIKNFLFDNFVDKNYIVVPDNQILDVFFEFMEKIEEKKQKNLEENQRLSSLRDWLLPMLMNGQITVS